MSFTEEQVATLLRPINPRRVLQKQGQSHVSQQDIRAHLTRVFGFGGWDKEILELTCVRDERITVPAVPAKDGKAGKPERKNVPAVTYRCTLRLTVWCPTRCCKSVSEDVGTGTAPNLPDYGDAHDFAAKNAVSYALKRCATDWGDQFGLSLYNKGQTKALVVDTLVGRPQRTEQDGAVDDQVPQQESLGDREPDYADDDTTDPAPVRPPAPTPGTNTERGPAGDAPGSAEAGKAYRAALLADIQRLAKVLRLPETELRIRMARAHGTTLEEATGGQLMGFRDVLREEAKAATAPPNEGEQG